MTSRIPTTDATLTRDLADTLTIANGGLVLREYEPEPTNGPYWKTGTELRNKDGFYQNPHPSLLRPGQEPEYFPAVSTFLRSISSEAMRRAEQSFAASETAAHVAVLREAMELTTCRDDVLYASVGVWDSDIGAMVGRPVLEVLADTRYMSMAGPRGMTRRAHRGTIMHDAQEEWAKGAMVGRRDVLRWDDPYLPDWVASARSANDYATPSVDEVLPFVVGLLKFLDRNVVSVRRAECAVYNRTLVYAGTLDMDGVVLDGHEGEFLFDAKSRGDITPRISDLLSLLSYQHAEFYADPMTGLLVPFKPSQRIANLYVAPDMRKDAEPNTCRAELRIWRDTEEFTLALAWQEVIRQRESWQVQHIISQALCGMAPIVKPPKNSLTVTPGAKRGRKKPDAV